MGLGGDASRVQVLAQSQLDPGLFAAFALANLAGHHADDGWEFGAVRRAVRLALAPRAQYWSDELDAAGLRQLVRRAGGALVMDVVPQLTAAPALAIRTAPLDYLTSWQAESLESLRGLDTVLGRFYREEGITGLWDAHRAAYAQEARLLDTVQPHLETIARDLRATEAGAAVSHTISVRLAPNLLDARGRGYSVSFHDETWLFFGPLEHAAQARFVAMHEFLHRWVDPIAERTANADLEPDPMPVARARYRIVAELYPELAIWIGETVVRALTAWYTARDGEAGTFDLDAVLATQERIGFRGVRDIVGRLRSAAVGASAEFIPEAVRLAHAHAVEAGRPDRD